MLAVAALVHFCRLKFVLFAAALPILAYWHYSKAEVQDGACNQKSPRPESLFLFGTFVHVIGCYWSAC